MIEIKIKNKSSKNFLESIVSKNFKESFYYLETLKNKDEVVKVEEYCESLKSKYSSLCVVGLGGSSLGAKAFADVLQKNSSDNSVYFLDNVDSYGFQQTMGKIDLKNCHWLFVSKSGGTQEVLALMNYINEELKSENISMVDNCTVVTSDSSESLLFQWSKENNVPQFFIPQEIGGRFSVFTPVGLIPLFYMGVSSAEVLNGVNWVRENESLIASWGNTLLDSILSGDSYHLYWSYSDRLLNLCNWTQQLWMESLGKEVSLSGDEAPSVSSLFVARGASDQHSILQMLDAEKTSKHIVFLTDDRAQTSGPLLSESLFNKQLMLQGQPLGKLLELELLGTKEALEAKGVPCSHFNLKPLSPASITAYMITYFEVVRAIAEHLNINPFDQPGVESSKRKTAEFLSRLP